MHTTLKSNEYRANGKTTPKRPQQSRLNIKVMINFFNYNGIVHYEFLLPSQTFNKKDYGRNYGRTTLCWFITIIHHVILYWFFATFLPKTSSAITVFAWFSYVRLLVYLKYQCGDAVLTESKKVLKTFPKKEYSECLEDWEK